MNQRRLDLIARHLSTHISIGSVTASVSKMTELVPMNTLQHSQQVLQHLQWMMKKDSLGQDIFLLGPPGPFKRRLALSYLALTRQELEYISMHPDISAESDLKQRREIEITENGQELKWVDGSCVRAAKYGRVLVIEGIEKAERNVLPVLNNLLENREMTLEDGRHIVSSEKYNELLKTRTQKELDDLGLIRAHEKFRVIAIGAPVPPYPGKPLDPPFRSRFQVRYIDAPFHDNTNPFIQNLSKAISAVRIGKTMDTPMLSQENMLPSFDQTCVQNVEKYISVFPLEAKTHFWSVLQSYWPSSWVMKQISSVHLDMFKKLLDRFGVQHQKSKFESSTSYAFKGVEAGKAVFEHKSERNPILVPIFTGRSSSKSKVTFSETRRCLDLVSRMVQTHAANQDILLVGPKSSSKTICIEKFASILHYDVSTIHLYRDITARDLLQRRNTRPDGSTYWEDSPLVSAAKHGDLVVMEGIHWVSSEVLSGIARLLQDREFPLPDGTLLVSQESYSDIKSKMEYSDEDMRSKGIFPVHPAFRVIATATNSKTESIEWFNEEIAGLFRFLKVEPMGIEEERQLLREQTKCNEDVLNKIIEFAEKFRALSKGSGHDNVLSKSIALSTRQLLRICQRAVFPDSDLYSLIHSVCLSPFLPHLARLSLDNLLKDVGIVKRKLPELKITDHGESISFGDINIPKFKVAEGDKDALALVPYTTTNSNEDSSTRSTSFFNNTTQTRVMRDLALGFALGEHLLLIGNQGVGKNKLTDRFLELIKYPREYIQLHRDTTVQSLLVQPAVENGRIIYKDSPLLKAVQKGRVLVIDEADKAPVYITSILKSLAETGEMDLGDGRRIRPAHLAGKGDIVTHPSFRMIVLANRPGFPFLGNDFYGAIGDVFGTYPIDNPDFNSEVTLLAQLAPSVQVETIKKLVGSFNDLRQAFDDGLINYPYSLRELIHIVRHMERFPGESIESVLRNVIDFDLHRDDLLTILADTFTKHGIPLKKSSLSFFHAAEENLAIKYSEKKPPEVSGPKHGKIDEKNDPHVGGNTWHGGTGGSDTAGLGGRGGPYRMDSGNPIHQLPDELKNQVPKEILDAARQMGKDALEKKLKDIEMNVAEADLFVDFSNHVKQQVQQLRVILEGVAAKKKERVWLRNQTDGELDDSKLVEGITGEHAIYKKRGREQSDFGSHELPKRIKFVFDVSGSMYRFNSYDQRLSKSLETALMIMESLKGLEHKYKYDIVGHSGDAAVIDFVKPGKPPKNEKEMLKVLQQMWAHAQYCWSGDNTLSATSYAIKDIVQENADDYIVVVLSDANLNRYGISPRILGQILEQDPKVSATIMFIGSLGDEATQLSKQLPKGRSFVVKNSLHIPLYMKEIFASVAEK